MLVKANGDIIYYAQDTWKATPKLTLALGLRADVFNPQTLNAAGNGGFPNLDTGQIDVAGVGSINLAGNVKNKVNFAPRIGVAYQINDKMVIRGGFGSSFDTGVFGTVFGHTVTQNLPVLALQNLNATNSVSRVFTLATDLLHQQVSLVSQHCQRIARAADVSIILRFQQAEVSSCLMEFGQNFG